MDRLLKGFHISAMSFTHELLMQHMKKYALSRNETGFTQALTEAEELIEHSVLKNSSRLRQSTLSVLHNTIIHSFALQAKTINSLNLF